MTTEDSSKLFVAGLSDSMTEDPLRQLFEGAGYSVVNVSLPKDRLTGRSRGFGFVTLGSPEQAQAARDSFDGSLQAGRPISVKPFTAGPRRETGRSEPSLPAAQAGGPSRTVYVGNLPYDVRQDDIQKLFEEQAGVSPTRVHLPLGPDGRMRGFGFVTAASDENAASAVEKLKDYMFRGRRLVVNLALPKGERAERPERTERPGERAPRPGPSGGAEPRPSWRDGAAPARDAGPALAPRSMPPRAIGARDDFFEPAKPLEGRRARGEVKQKKVKEKRKVAERPGKKSKGGGSTWHNWADLDDEE